MTDPYASPKSDLNDGVVQASTRYAGFWIRVGASIIDSILLLFITMPLLFLLDGPQSLDPEYLGLSPMGIIIQFVLPVVGVILFWVYRSATPGKILLKLRIVNADDGGKPSAGRFILRYVGYILSAIPLLLGYVWVAFDKRKQSFHDKIAKTVVVRD